MGENELCSSNNVKSVTINMSGCWVAMAVVENVVEVTGLEESEELGVRLG